MSSITSPFIFQTFTNARQANIERSVTQYAIFFIGFCCEITLCEQCVSATNAYRIWKFSFPEGLEVVGGIYYQLSTGRHIYASYKAIFRQYRFKLHFKVGSLLMEIVVI
ncbi:hypothetical protein DWB67_15745 [Paracoccus sp. JM45]|nr:hypothetical protein DWB67_15745 [Paracoccus sp. JM45]